MGLIISCINFYDFSDLLFWFFIVWREVKINDSIFFFVIGVRRWRGSCIGKGRLRKGIRG